MSEGKKTDGSGFPLDDSVPSETPKLLQHNLKQTAPYYPSPAKVKEASGEHPVPIEYAATAMSKALAVPATAAFDFAKTQPSAANPLLAKLQAEEKAAVEKQLAAARAAASRPPVPTQGPGVAAPRPAGQPDLSPLQRLRQPLASRPLGPPVPTPVSTRSPDVITDPLPRGGVPPAVAQSKPSAPTVVQRPPQAAPKTDPMQSPDVLAAISANRVAIPPPAPLPPRSAPISKSVPSPGMKVPPPVWAVPPSGAPPPTAPRPPPPVSAPSPWTLIEHTDVPKRPVVTAPPVGMKAPQNEKTEIARPAPPTERVAPIGDLSSGPTQLQRPPGVPMPAAAMKTQPGLFTAGQAAEKTETRPDRLPNATPSIAVGRPAVPVSSRIGMPTDVSRPVARAAAPEVDPWLPSPSQIDLTPAAARGAVKSEPWASAAPSAPGHTGIAPLVASEFDFTPAAPRPLIPSQAGVTPVDPRPAVTAPNRPAPVVPPSFMDLPQIGAREQTTQPGVAGPYSAQQPLRLELATAADEPVASDQVLATPASLWRRTFASVFDLALLGAVIGGLLFLAVGLASGGKPLPNNLHGIDAFFFRLHPIAIPALGLTVLLAVLYTTMGAFLLRGRTFGRLLFGIRLVDSSGKSPGAIRSLFRAFLAIVSFVFFLAGFWLGLFDRKGQTLHDKLTRTFVVRPV